MRPVLSCPYCGAFRSAVSLEDGTPALPPEPDTAAPVDEDVIYAGHDEPVDEPADDIHPVSGDREEPLADLQYDPPVPEPEPAGPFEEPVAAPAHHPSEEASARPVAARRIRRDRSRLDAVPNAPREPEPAPPPPEAERSEPRVSAAPRRAEPPLGRRAGRLDRAPTSPSPETVEAESVTRESAESTGSVPREPSVPRGPTGRRRMGPMGSRRRARAERRAEEEAWIASESEAEEAADPTIDDVMRDAESPRGRRSESRSLVPVSDDDATVPAEYRPRRRKGARAGWIVFVLVLLAIGAGLLYGAYWVDKQGIADLLRSAPIQIGRLGEAETIEVPGEWTTVPDPAAGSATALLVKGSGPFRMRVDGTVYTLDGGRGVRVPVKESTLVELKALDGPVTAEVTRLGEEGN